MRNMKLPRSFSGTSCWYWRFLYLVHFSSHCYPLSFLSLAVGFKFTNKFTWHILDIVLKRLLSYQISWSMSRKSFCCIITCQKCRSSYQRCYIKKAVLKTFAMFTGKDLCWSLLLVKLQAFSKVTGLLNCCFCEDNFVDMSINNWK